MSGAIYNSVDDYTDNYIDNYTDNYIDTQDETSSFDHLYAVEVDIRLRSVVAFSQVFLADLRLVTLIGERHSQEFDCDGQSYSVAQYCVAVLTTNPNSKILLEYNPGQSDPRSVESHSIRETHQLLLDENWIDEDGSWAQGGEPRVVPFDYRSYFLSWRGQLDLYSNRFYDYDYESIESSFVRPFFDAKRKDPGIFGFHGRYSEEDRGYLDQYYADMVGSFIAVSRMIKGGVSRELIHERLMSAWMAVADWYILQDMFRADGTDELVVVVGKKHYDNLRRTLREFEISHQSYDDSHECVSLYRTLRLEGLDFSPVTAEDLELLLGSF